MTEAPSPPPPSGAPFPGAPPQRPAPGRLLDVGDWLTDTTRALVDGFGDFFAVLAIVSLVSTGISAPMLWSSASDVVLRRDDDGAFTSVEGLSSNQGTQIAVAVMIIFAAQLFLFAAATIHVDGVRSGQSPRWNDTFRAMLRRGPRVIGVVFQMFTLVFVLLVISGVLGGLGLGGVAGFIALGAMIWLWLRSAVASTHAALGAAGGSVARSFSWSKGRLWPLLGRHVLLTTIGLGVLLISSFVAAPFQSLAGVAQPAGGDLVLRELIGSSAPAFLAVQLINALGSGLVAALWASGMLSLYRGERVSD